MKFLKIENSFLNIIEDSNDLERTLDKEKEFFSKEILEILFHESKNKLNDNFIESVYSEILISKEKLDIFLSYLFYKNNIKHVFHRVGDVNLRSDMILQSNNNVGLVEIEKGNNLLDPPRNILEQYALLKSRYDLKQKISCFIFTSYLPRKRQDYWNVIEDISNITGIKIKTISFASLFLLYLSENLSLKNLEKFDIVDGQTNHRQVIGESLLKNISVGFKGILEIEK